MALAAVRFAFAFTAGFLFFEPGGRPGLPLDACSFIAESFLSGFSFPGSFGLFLEPFGLPGPRLGNQCQILKKAVLLWCFYGILTVSQVFQTTWHINLAGWFFF
ncbi:MAG: hypothetical protein Q4A32_04645 [Lachnospiraceae bacterium]|nr:hypothetical protein [Lachnospiraceae bacterium]